MCHVVRAIGLRLIGPRELSLRSTCCVSAARPNCDCGYQVTARRAEIARQLSDSIDPNRTDQTAVQMIEEASPVPSTSRRSVRQDTAAEPRPLSRARAHPLAMDPSRPAAREARKAGEEGAVDREDCNGGRPDKQTDG